MNRCIALATLAWLALSPGTSLAAALERASAAAPSTIAPGRSLTSDIAAFLAKDRSCPERVAAETAGSSGPAEQQPQAIATFHVSPAGSDAWGGRLARPDAQRSDGPFASFEAGRDAARRAAVPSRIVVGGGDYYLEQPVVFDARDAGLAVVAACGETPVLHGGPLVGGWVHRPGGRWMAALAPSAQGTVGALFVNGQPRPLARYPDAPTDGDPRRGWLFAAKPDVDEWQGNTQFRYHPGELPQIDDLTGVVAHIVGGYAPGSQWGSDTLPVTAIDRPTNTVHTQGTAYFYTAEGSRYFLAGAKAFLDAPGEWWYDAGTGRLDYIADDQSFADARVVAGVLPTLFRLENADGMLLSGLEFRDGAPLGSGKFGTDTRGYGAIRLEQADGVKLIDNVIDNVGVGIHVAESNDVLIAGNKIAHIAGNGIYLGTNYGHFGKSNRAQILSNHIHDVGEVYFESAGIWFQAADGVRIALNLIEDTAQFGIAGGSIWGSDDSVHGAVIEDNALHHTNQKTADGGAIKMMGMQADLQDTLIRRNVVTGTGHLMNRPDGTFWPAGYENTEEWPSPISWAIYTDGKASGVRIEGNLLSDNVSGIGINGGWNNVVTGNTISDGSGSAFRIDDGTGRDWHPPWAQPNLIEDNDVTITSDKGLVASVYAPGHGVGYIHFTRNRYVGNLNDQSFQIRPEIMPSGQYGGLVDVQKAGVDEGSVEMPPPGAAPAALP